MKKQSSYDRTLYIVGWIGLVSIFIYIGLKQFVNLDLLGIWPPCPLHTVTGYYCPGCGGTRAVYALLHGNIIRSFLYHPFVIYTTVICGWFMISQTIQRVSKDRIKIAMSYRDIYLWIGMVLILINVIVKDLLIAIGGIYVMG